MQGCADTIPYAVPDAVDVGNPIDPPERNTSEHEFQPDTCTDPDTDAEDDPLDTP